MSISTRRITLVPATPELVRAAIGGNAALAAALGAQVPASWPPEFLASAANGRAERLGPVVRSCPPPRRAALSPIRAIRETVRAVVSVVVPETLHGSLPCASPGSCSRSCSRPPPRPA